MKGPKPKGNGRKSPPRYYLEIVEDSDKIVYRTDLTDRTKQEREKIESGYTLKVDPDRFYIRWTRTRKHLERVE